MKKKPDTTTYYDILIAGGGAAGLAAAVSAGLRAKSVRPASALRIGVLEKKEVPGKKLSATGNGRCNLSNAVCADREEVDGFFDAIGLVTRTDEAGRMYPYGEEASEVAALLTDTVRSLQAEILTDCTVEKVRFCAGFARGEDVSPVGFAGGEIASSVGSAEEGGFQVTVSSCGGQQFFFCRRMLLAMGGKSYSVFGTSGDGYGLARRLGHTVTRLAPSLVPVQVEEDLKDLAGVRTRAEVRLLHFGREVARETGEVQFNKDCLSGICMMNLSRLLVLNPEKPFGEAFREYELVLDLLPEYSQQEVCRILAEKNGSLQTLVKRRLARWIRQKTEAVAGNAGAAGSAESTETVKILETAGPAAEKFREYAALLKALRFTVSGTKGWNDAQVTRGGVVMEEVNPVTMESVKVAGLFFAGEILDYDGPCGGFNLHFAWKSGIRAGKAMADGCLAGCRAAESAAKPAANGTAQRR